MNASRKRKASSSDEAKPELLSKGLPLGQVNWKLPGLSSFPPAVKRMLAYQVEREMARQNISPARLAELMSTSRAAVNRLLDPENRSVTLQTIERVSQILGKRLQIFFNE